jgi:apolipoprotein N-acyltransferase
VAAVAGLLWAGAFPPLGVAGFAWIAPALLVAAAQGRDRFEALRLGYLAGLVSALAQFYWLLLIPVTGFPILGWWALSAYLALFPAVWLCLVTGKLGEGGWVKRTFWSLLGAAVWVALEMVRARFLGGFPWNLLGVSQYQMTPLIQFASFTGVYGVSFLVVWSSLSLLNAVQAILRRPLRRLAWQAEIILPLAAVLTAYFFGLQQLRAPADGTSTLRVTFVQPSIPQRMIWDDSESGRRFAQLLGLTRTALTNETDLLLWPEAALPNVGQTELAALMDLVRAHGVWMILGADDVEFGAGFTNYFNAGVLLNPRGESVAVYHKRKLVMFGEYIPFTRWLPFVKYFTPITGGFTPGDKPVTFQTVAQGRGVKLRSLVCFEDIFPDFVREYADPDTDFLVNLTNDGWFGNGAAQWQHAANAVFRTVENGLPLLRCCNNGVTCWIDARGRIRQIFRDERGKVHGAGVMTAQIPLPPAGEKRAPTFYNRHGDWLGWICVGLATPVMLVRLPKIRRRKWGDV